MDNFVPFDKLEVGKEYYVYSRYWRKVLGTATMTKVNPATGTAEAISSWGDKSLVLCSDVVLWADHDYMFRNYPTDDEIEEARKTKNESPRELRGVYYSGGEIDKEWKVELNNLCENLRKSFDNEDLWKEGDILWAEKFDYPISELLIRASGRCDWESIEYVKKKGNFTIHRGDGDSFGWLSGVIRDKKTGHEIVYD